MKRAKTRRRRPILPTLKDLRETSVHEAGHVIADVHFGISFVDVVMNADGSGCVHVIDAPDPQNLREAENFTICCYAGIAAEQVILNREPLENGSHYEDYRIIVDFLQPFFRKEHRFDAFTDKMYNRATKLIHARREAVNAIATALFSRRRLTAPEVRKILAKTP